MRTSASKNVKSVRLWSTKIPDGIRPMAVWPKISTATSSCRNNDMPMAEMRKASRGAFAPAQRAVGDALEEDGGDGGSTDRAAEGHEDDEHEHDTGAAVIARPQGPRARTATPMCRS